MRAKNSVIGVYKSESLKPVIDAGHMPFYQIIRKLGLALTLRCARRYLIAPGRPGLSARPDSVDRRKLGATYVSQPVSRRRRSLALWCERWRRDSRNLGRLSCGIHPNPKLQNFPSRLL